MSGTPSPVLVLPVGQAPSMAMGTTYVAMAGSIALAMGNAVAAQQRGQLVGEAALASVLTLIIAKGGS
ncbi:MAG: RebB family R body protein [Sphingomonas sp.]